MAAMLELVFDPAGDLLDATRDCEADIFLQSFGNTRQQLAEEYGPYEQDSVFVSLVDGAGDVVACGRLLTGLHTALKTIDDLRRPPWRIDGARSAGAAGLDLTRTWDLATMGVRPGVAHGRTRLACALYHGGISALRVNEAAAMVAIVDDRVRRLLQSIGLNARAIPGAATAPYLGSDASTPVYAHLAAAFDRQRRDSPDAHRLVTLGIGLDGVRVPAREQFRLPVRVPAAWTSRPLSAPVGDPR